MTHVGDLRHRLELEKLSRVSDGAGGYTESWASVASIWAAIAAKSGRETVIAERLSSHVTYDIIIRYRSDVTAEMRFRDGAKLYYIVAFFDMDGHEAWLKCVCEQRDN